MIINTNTSASLASYNLGRTNQDHQRNLIKLSSGLRINSSYDDAAGLAVSMKMNAQIRRADAYAANVENSRSFLQTQDGALKQLGNLLQRMSELKALAHDVTKNSGDVDLYENEYIQLQEQFVQIATEKFNGINLFSPTSTPDPLYLSHPERGDTIQVSRPSLVDLHTGDTLRIGFRDYTVVGANGLMTWQQARDQAENLGGVLATITSQEEQLILEQSINDQINSGNATRNNFWIGGQYINNSLSWVSGESSSYDNFKPGYPLDSNFFPNNTDIYIAVNSNPPNPNEDFKWINNTNMAPNNGMGGFVLEKTIRLLDLPWSDLHSTIQQVANARAQNGAEQMQLQMAADLNATNTVNLEQALSRIQDVDIAQVTSDLARTKVLIEAGTAMLAQANASQDSILKLIESGRS